MSVIDPAAFEGCLEVTLTAEQRRVVYGAPQGPAGVVAGAGSGKTTVMAARMIAVLAQGRVRPDGVLGLTFTRKAAGELAARVELFLRRARAAGVVEPGEEVPLVATYHSFAQGFITEHGLRIGLDPDTRVEGDFVLTPLARRVVGRSRALAGFEHDLSVSAATAAVRALDAELAEHLVTTDRLREHETRRIGALQAGKSTAGLTLMLAASTMRRARSGSAR